MSALYRLFLRSQLVRGRILGIALLGVLGILLGVAIRASEGATRSDAAHLVASYGLALFVPVAVLLFASSVLGDPDEDGTLVYLWLRPVARWRIVAAGLAATLTISLPLVVGPMAVAAAATGAGGELVVGAVAACTLGTVAYTALFTWLGLRTRRALVWGVAYILIWEGFVARAGASASRLSVRASTRSVLGHLADGPADLLELGLGSAVAIPLAAAAVAVALTVRRLTTQDVA